jgi:hypothetical protein
MTRKNVTLSLEEGVYEKYQEYCTKNAVALSRSIELYMEKKMKEDEDE